MSNFGFLAAGEAGQAAKLAVFGSVVSLIGDAIATYAAALAIEEELQEQKPEQDTRELLCELRDMKTQIQSLAEELRYCRQATDNDRSAGRPPCS